MRLLICHQFMSSILVIFVLLRLGRLTSSLLSRSSAICSYSFWVGCSAFATPQKLMAPRQSVPTPLLLSELRQSQMSDVWLLRAAGLWVSTVAIPGMHRLALDAVQLAWNGVRSGYVAVLMAYLIIVGCDFHLGGLPEIDITELRRNLRTRRNEVRQELHVSPAWGFQPMRVCAHITGGSSH